MDSADRGRFDGPRLAALEGSRDSTARGTTADTHYTTGFDATRDEPPKDVERIFPIARTGERFVIAVAGFATVLVRIAEDRWGGE